VLDAPADLGQGGPVRSAGVSAGPGWTASSRWVSWAPSGHSAQQASLRAGHRPQWPCSAVAAGLGQAACPDPGRPRPQCQKARAHRPAGAFTPGHLGERLSSVGQRPKTDTGGRLVPVAGLRPCGRSRTTPGRWAVRRADGRSCPNGPPRHTRCPRSLRPSRKSAFPARRPASATTTGRHQPPLGQLIEGVQGQTPLLPVPGPHRAPGSDSGVRRRCPTPWAGTAATEAATEAASVTRVPR